MINRENDPHLLEELKKTIKELCNTYKQVQPKKLGFFKRSHEKDISYLQEIATKSSSFAELSQKIMDLYDKLVKRKYGEELTIEYNRRRYRTFLNENPNNHHYGRLLGILAYNLVPLLDPMIKKISPPPEFFNNYSQYKTCLEQLLSAAKPSGSDNSKPLNPTQQL